MEIKEKILELEKTIEEKLSDFEKETGLQISFVNRRENGFKIDIRI